MKKLLFALGFFGITLFSFAGNGEKYKVNDAAVDQLFAQSQDVSSALADGDMTLVNLNQPSTQVVGGGQTVGGFLLRSFFCGFIAIHRKYMGSDLGSLWWKYFCIPVAGGVANLGDFCWVLFKGNSALSKYKGSDKWFVWA
ncbi:MAG: hypothetical protein HY841_09055 [Bacteroidetes bacterium]|nr:hypothetical protein [Bacteroidota bacterium]